MAWETLYQITLGSSTAQIDSGTITAKKFLYLILHVVEDNGGQSNSPSYRFNGDTGTNYPLRRNNNNGSDTTYTTTYDYLYNGYGSDHLDRYLEMYIINDGSREKLVIQNQSIRTTAGAGTAPDKNYMWGKWTNNSNQITQIVTDATGFDGSVSDLFGADTTLAIMGTD